MAPRNIFCLEPQLLDRLRVGDATDLNASSDLTEEYVELQYWPLGEGDVSSGGNPMACCRNVFKSAGELDSITISADGQKGRTCLVCGVTFATLDEQRSHFKSDWHRLNVRRKLRGLPVLSEEDAARLIDDGVSSISGSGERYPLYDGLSNHIIREAARAIVKGLPSSHDARA